MNDNCEEEIRKVEIASKGADVPKKRSCLDRFFKRIAKVSVETPTIELLARERTIPRELTLERWSKALNYARRQVKVTWRLKPQSPESDFDRKKQMLESIFLIYARGDVDDNLKMNMTRFRAFCRDYDLVGKRKGVESLASKRSLLTLKRLCWLWFNANRNVISFAKIWRWFDSKGVGSMPKNSGQNHRACGLADHIV